MFRKQAEMKDINNCFSVNQNTVIVSDKNGAIWLNDTVIFQGEKYLFATIQKKDFFVFGNSEKLFSGKITDKKFENTARNIFSNTYSEKGIIMYENRVFIEELSNYKYDAIYHEYQTGFNKLILKQMSGIYEFLYDSEKKAIIRDMNTVKSLSLETGEYEWEVDISQYTNQEGFSYKEAKIDSILGISDTELIILVWSSILIIDLQTGQIKADIVGIGSKKYFPEGRSMGFTYHFHLEGEYVYLLKRERYISIHLPTQTVSILWENEDPNLNIDRVSYDENYAYFMATKAWDVQASILGVFDRKALEIVWQHDQPIYSSKPPQSDGNKLHCLDSEGTLHIFERENS